MKNEEILKKAIRKASSKGLELTDNLASLLNVVFYEDLTELKKEWIDNERYYQIIFSHDFAKAIFGEEETKWTTDSGKECRGKPAYIIHLQRMVIEENPLKYLEKWI